MEDAEDRYNNAFNTVAEAQLSPDVANDNSDFEDMSSSIFANIDSRIPENYDWLTNYNDQLEIKLQEYSNQYYIKKNAMLLMKWKVH